MFDIVNQTPSYHALPERHESCHHVDSSLFSSIGSLPEALSLQAGAGKIREDVRHVRNGLRVPPPESPRANYLAQRSPVSVQPIENRMASKGGSEGSSGGMADVGAVFAPAQTQSEIDLVERSAQESLLERRRGWSTGNLEKESLLCVRAPLFYI